MPSLSWQLKDRETWFPIVSSLECLEGAEVLPGQVSCSKWKLQSGRPAGMGRSLARCPWHLTQHFPYSKQESYLSSMISRILWLDKTHHYLDMVYPSIYKFLLSKFAISVSSFNFHISGGNRAGRGMKCTLLLCISRSKVQQYPLINEPIHMRDGIGDHFWSFKKCSCKALTIGNRMWFLFSCDQEVGNCGVWL